MSQSAKPSDQGRSKRVPLIYLVDDQAMLLDLAELALQPLGFQMRKFVDPEAAVAAFLKARIKPDLIFTDYAMGRMNGVELIEQCKRAHPALKAILTSGTAGAEIVMDAPVKVDRFIGKPYPPESLAALVKRVLEE